MANAPQAARRSATHSPASSPRTAVQSAITQEIRSHARPKPKPKKVGRPKLAKGDAKAVMLRVRISPVEAKALEAKAKARAQTVSEWIRATLFPAAVTE